MIDNFGKRLMEMYPELTPEGQTSYTSYGVQTEHGWHPIIKEAIDKIARLNFPTKIQQIKEKFGGLRIYLSCSNEEINQIISEAEEKAEKTCEQCGAPGKLYKSGGWLHNCCETHKREDAVEFTWKNND